MVDPIVKLSLQAPGGYMTDSPLESVPQAMGGIAHSLTLMLGTEAVCTLWCLTSFT